MKLFLLCSLVSLTSAQLPFNIFSIPPTIRDPILKTYLKVSKMDTQCFKDLKKGIKDLLLAALTAQKCTTLECLKDEKITNATYAMKMLAAMGHSHSLDMDEMAGPFENKYCFVHVDIDWTSIDLVAVGLSSMVHNLPGGKIPVFSNRDNEIERCSKMALSNVKIGFCIPASCERDTDVGWILANVTNGTARICEINCVGPKEEPNAFFYIFKQVLKLSLAILLMLLVVSLAASILDYVAVRNGLDVEMKKRTDWRIFTSFSILRNTSEVFSIRKSTDSILCLDAIRFITFTWIVNGHADTFVADGDNGLQVFRASNYFFSDIFLNPYASVDTFYLLSGLLVAYSFFKKAHNKPEFVTSLQTWIMYYVHRWLRLTPVYLMFIGLYVAWTPRLHDVWATSATQNTTLFVQNCESGWWKNALYISNFQDFVDMCYLPSWFLSVDTELYWAAPLFLLAIYYSLKIALGVGLGAVMVSSGVNIFHTVYYDLPALAFTVKSPGNMDFETHFYTKPWTRCIPYLIGIVCGYLIVQIRQKTLKIGKPKMCELIVCWTLSTTFALATIFSVYNYARGQTDWSIAERALYGILSRLGWSAAVAWVVVACTFDWAGPVKSLLEHPLWYPLGRLSYCAFLAHWFVLQLVLNGSDRPPHFVSLWHTYLTVTVPVVVLSYAMAYVFNCLVETPLAKIEGIVVELLIRRPQQRSKTDGKEESGMTTIELDTVS